MIFKNENVNEEILAILKEFHLYLPRTGDGDIDGQLFSGDQLTVERAVNVIASVANGHIASHAGVWRVSRLSPNQPPASHHQTFHSCALANQISLSHIVDSEVVMRG